MSTIIVISMSAKSLGILPCRLPQNEKVMYYHCREWGIEILLAIEVMSPYKAFKCENAPNV